MKKVFLFILVLMVIMTFVFTSQGMAFEKTTFENGSELTVYGFLRNNTGMFTGTQEFAENGNQLATVRTWLRAYGDYKINDQWRLWAAVQGVHEPTYKVEKDAQYSENGGPGPTRHPRWWAYSEFYNINDVLREAYVSWTPNQGNNIRFGRQLAIWGEALTTRVGDVIHPDDTRWGFAFANLEDTRIPQYMIRGIHDISSISSSFEWIVNPLLLQQEWSVNRLPTPTNLGGPGEQRFAPALDQRLVWPYNIGIGPMWPITSSFVNIPGVGPFPLNGVPDVHFRYPTGISDTRYGAKTSTTISGWTFGLSYWHTQAYTALVERGAKHGVAMPAGTYPWVTADIPYQEYTFTYPNYDMVGFYFNKQLPWPGVLRCEAVYSWNMPFNTFNMGPGESGIVRRDNVKYLVAYDLMRYIMPSWHTTDSINIIFEHIGEWTPNSSDLQYLAPAYGSTKYPNYHAQFNTRIWTTWLYNKVNTELVVGYDTFGNSGFVMPSVKYTFPWLNERLSAELKYIGIYGQNQYEGMGIVRGKDMVLLTTQFNF